MTGLDALTAITRTATVFELRRDDHDRVVWHPVADLAIGRQRPATALSIWVTEREPGPGTYRLQASDGGRASVWLAGPERGAA